MQMELSDDSVIAAILSATERPKRADLESRNTRTANASPRGAKPRRCACGKCFTCVDNARWERIFNEKFADPSYYLSKPVTFASPLA